MINGKIITLRINETGKIEYESEKIDGLLKGMIISSDNSITLQICLAESPDVVLFEKQGYWGEKYLGLRADTVFYNDERGQGDGVEWALKNKLKISADGPIGTEVKIIVRYE